MHEQSHNHTVLLKRCFTFTETVGLLGTGAQDRHLDYHTAPELSHTVSTNHHFWRKNETRSGIELTSSACQRDAEPLGQTAHASDIDTVSPSEEYWTYLPSTLRQQYWNLDWVTTDYQSSKDTSQVFQGTKEYVLFVTVVR